MATAPFRRAGSSDRARLDELTLEGVRHWGHHVNHPEAYAGLEAELAGDDDPSEHHVLVWEDEDGVAGFVDLRDRGDHAELLRMFLRPALIGQGHGRMLWERAVATASTIADRLLIVSDPEATGFYEAMGARPERTVEPVPGFVLTVFWYDLD